MISTDDRRQTQDPQRAFFAKVQESLTSASGKLFAPFEAAQLAIGQGDSFNEAEFYEKFLIYANEFTADCCTSCAAVTRELALVPETRGTPTKVLAKELRSQAFDRLDSLFIEAFQALSQCDVDLSTALQNLQRTDVMSATLEGAIAGGLVGSVFHRSRTGAILGAGIGASNALDAQLAHLTQALHATGQARALVATTIQEWLESIIDMPEPLLDWVGAKCFGGAINLSIQRECQQEVIEVFRSYVNRARDTILRLKQEKIVHQQEEEQKKIERQAEQEREQERTGNEVTCENCKTVFDRRNATRVAFGFHAAKCQNPLVKCPKCGYMVFYEGLTVSSLYLFGVTLLIFGGLGLLPIVFPNDTDGSGFILIIAVVSFIALGAWITKTTRAATMHNKQCREAWQKQQAVLGITVPFVDNAQDSAPQSKPDTSTMKDIRIVLKTGKGNIDITLFPSKAPVTCASFLNLAKKGKYDGITFHRVIPNFMIQGGDPTGTGSGDRGYKFEDECVPALRFDKPGVLAMANAGPGTNGSQFFITHVPTPWLNGKHTIFGQVTKGQDVVNAVAQGDKITGIEILAPTDELFTAQAARIAKFNYYGSHSMP